MTEMASESRPRPLPKPRRPKSMDIGASKNQSTCFNISASVPASIKPPITKPKPTGYKQLDFGKTGLVDIKTDIELSDASPANSRGDDCTKDNGVLEKNNNVANLKHGNGKGFIGNGLKADTKVCFSSVSRACKLKHERRKYPAVYFKSCRCRLRKPNI